MLWLRLLEFPDKNSSQRAICRLLIRNSRTESALEESAACFLVFKYMYKENKLTIYITSGDISRKQRYIIDDVFSLQICALTYYTNTHLTQRNCVEKTRVFNVLIPSIYIIILIAWRHSVSTFLITFMPLNQLSTILMLSLYGRATAYPE